MSMSEAMRSYILQVIFPDNGLLIVRQLTTNCPVRYCIARFSIIIFSIFVQRKSLVNRQLEGVEVTIFKGIHYFFNSKNEMSCGKKERISSGKVV